MYKTKDEAILSSVMKMNYCCGPFARMRIETRTFAINLLQLHNAAFDNDPNYADCELNRQIITILASDKAEFVKKEQINEIQKAKGETA